MICPMMLIGNHQGDFRDKCKGSDCAWWDADDGQCALVSVAKALKVKYVKCGDITYPLSQDAAVETVRKAVDDGRIGTESIEHRGDDL